MDCPQPTTLQLPEPELLVFATRTRPAVGLDLPMLRQRLRHNREKHVYAWNLAGDSGVQLAARLQPITGNKATPAKDDYGR